MNLRPNEIVIDDDNFGTHIDTMVDGKWMSRGCVPRVKETEPHTTMRSLPDIPLIPRSEWAARIDEMEKTGSRLSDIRLRGNAGEMIPSLDQNGKGYCWAHSSTHAMIMARAVAGLPYVPLSAYAVACKIKNFRDEGGWGALSMDFICQQGVPSSQYWPMQSMAFKNDNPATWENARLHRCLAGWYDLDQAQYDRTLTQDQIVSLLLSRIPVVGDYNWWGHSVLLLDAVRDGNDIAIRIWNSWGDGWSDRGMGILRGSKAFPNGAVAPRLITPSIV
jgi:hypothetical protein